MIEERRENPGPFSEFRLRVDQQKKSLRERPVAEFTLLEMIDMFSRIYRNAYYGQDAWKLGMHLSEEFGEATIELSRIDLAWRGGKRFDVRLVVGEVFKAAGANIEKEVERITNPDEKEFRRRQLKDELDSLELSFNAGNPWDVFLSLVGERFKEEVSDVFSWLSAIIIKLAPDYAPLGKVRNTFVAWRRGSDVLKCPWCDAEECSDQCLVVHSVASEITEKIRKL